jgi:hypothetical protein
VANRTPEVDELKAAGLLDPGPVSGAGNSLNQEVVPFSWLGLAAWIGFDCIEPLDQTFRKRLQIVP